MSTAAMVWFLVGALATLILGVVVWALVRQVLLVGRSAVRLADEARAITTSIDGPGRRSAARR